jgi:hypothetical protein
LSGEQPADLIEPARDVVIKAVSHGYAVRRRTPSARTLPPSDGY